MESTYRLYCLLLLLVLQVSSVEGSGAWFKYPRQLSAFTKQFEPSFIFLKLGIFSKKGRVKFLNASAAKKACPPHITKAWITHRLSKGERLSAEVGRKIGDTLAQQFKGSCVNEIQLNIEPLPTPPKWLTPFLKAIKTQLPETWRLTLTTPPITQKTIPGLHWTRVEAIQQLEVIDGLDLMLYDTGLTQISNYVSLLHENLNFVQHTHKKFPQKMLTLGLPAYRDRTQLHRLNVENLSRVLKAFQSYKKKAQLCGINFHIAYYAGWTMRKEDFSKAKKIDLWKAGLCA